LFVLSNNRINAVSNSDIREDVAKVLIKNGFENIRIKIDDKKFILAYENRVDRFELEGIRDVIFAVIPLLNDYYNIVLVPLNRKIPLVYIEANINSCLAYKSKKITGPEFASELIITQNTDEVYTDLLNEREYNESDFKFDIAVKPTVQFEFGPYNHPVMGQINIVPEVMSSWWKGMGVNYELIVPAYNDPSFGARADSVHSGVIALNQVFRLPNSLFLSGTAGFFTQNRYGVDFEISKYWLNGDLNLSGNLGYTSFASFSGMRRLLYSDIFSMTGSLSTQYRIEKYNLIVGVMVGKFLLGDESIRIDINREFNEIDIGFFAIRSRAGVSNGGINLSIPIFPSRYWNPGILRIRTADSFSLSYAVRSNSNDFIGLRYDTDNRLNSFDKKLNPSFIRNLFNSDF
jgi:hypothetical protein